MIVGIGVGGEEEKVARTVERAGSQVRIVCYCRPGAMDAYPVERRESECPWEALIADLVAGQIDAAVRGTLPANETLRCLKKACGLDHRNGSPCWNLPASWLLLMRVRTTPLIYRP